MAFPSQHHCVVQRWYYPRFTNQVLRFVEIKAMLSKIATNFGCPIGDA